MAFPTIVSLCFMLVALSSLNPDLLAPHTPLTRPSMDRTSAAYQAKPIPVHDEAFTRWTYRKAIRAMYQRIMHEAYQEHGHRSPTWDTDMAALIDDMIEYKYSPWEGALSRDTLLERARVLRDLGSRDPLLLYFLGLLLQDAEEWHEAKRAYLSAAVEYERQAHPLYLQCLLAARLQRLYQTHGTNHEVHCAAWQRRLATWLPLAMAETIQGRSEWRIMADYWNYRWDLGQVPDEAAAMMDQLRQTPGIDPWFLDVAEGRWHIRQAWDARGSGFASTVSEEGWAGFRKHLAEARTHLKRAWETHADDPTPASMMITLAMAGHAGPGETLRMWFDRAVAVQLDHRPSYNRIQHGMLPRWGGSIQALLDFGFECYRTGRYDTGIPFQLYRTMRYIEVEDPDHTYWQDPTIAAALQDLFLNYIEQGRPIQRAEYAAYLVGTAWLSGDLDLAANRLDAYGDMLDASILQSVFSLDGPSLREQIAFMTHPVSQDIEKISARFNDGDFEGVNKLIRVTREAYDTLPDLSRQRLRDYEIRADWITRLPSGDWVDLPFEPDLPGWTIDAGTWDVREDASVKVRSSLQGAFLLLADSPGEYFEVSGELEFISTLYDTSFNAGFSLGCRDDPFWEHLQITAFMQQQHVRWGTSNRIRPDSLLFRCPIERRMRFGLQVQPNQLVIRFGEQEETVAFTEDFALSEGAKTFGIGGVYWYEGATIVFRNLRMRLLSDGHRDRLTQSMATREN